MSVCLFKQKTAYEMRISDWSSDVCSSDLNASDGHAEAILAKIENDADSATKKRIAKYGSIDPIYPTPNNWAWTTIGRMSRDWGQKVPDKPFHYIDVGGIDNLKGQIRQESSEERRVGKECVSTVRARCRREN